MFHNPNKRDNLLWRKLLFARDFHFYSVHTAYDTTIKLAELVRYADQQSDLRRMTDFIRKDDKHFDMIVLIKHDLGKRAYYTSTIVIGMIESRPDGETAVYGTARFGSTYLGIVIGVALFCIVFMIGTIAEPVVAVIWGALLLFMLSHIRQMFLDRNAIIAAMEEKVLQPLQTQAEREADVGDWQPISRYSEANFYNTQAR